MELNTIYCMDCLQGLATLPDNSIDCCVTSPPYWGLRDYGTAKWEGGDENCEHLCGKLASDKSKLNGGKGVGKNEKLKQTGMPYRIVCKKCGAVRLDNQIGLEETPEQYVEKMVQVFREVRRVLKPEGTLWLNLGDSYCGSNSTKNAIKNPNSLSAKAGHSKGGVSVSVNSKVQGLKPKDLVGIPWRTAFALQADGWWLRQDIIWHKPNPMPESVTDRCTKAHEYIFLLTKSAKYYYNNEAIKEKGKVKYTSNSFIPSSKKDKKSLNYTCATGASENNRSNKLISSSNKRSVWTVTTKPYKEAHFATYPPDLIEPCIKAGCPPGGVVLDPFMGSGTTAEVALRHGRNFVGFELNPEYVELIERRIAPYMQQARLEVL